MKKPKRYADIGIRPREDGGFLVFVQTPDGQRSEKVVGTQQEAEDEVEGLISLMVQSKFIHPVRKGLPN